MRKTVLVTGASRGIGRAVATKFARSGYDVVINYNKSGREALELETILRGEGCSVEAFQADIASNGSVREMMEFAVGRFGSVDILINNAGIAWSGLLTDTCENEWDRMMDVTLKGAYNCSFYAIPFMVSEKWGKIVNISSIWGMTGASCEVSYSTAKAGIIGFTKALAKELGPSNINVNCVAPGVIDTDMNGGLSEDDMRLLVDETPLMRIGRPEDVADTVFFLCSEEAGFITGQVISPNGGLVV
jgi:3-oxoacyl-[acyl-carrier protein] reductase